MTAEMVPVQIVKNLIEQQAVLQNWLQKQQREIITLQNKMERMFIVLDKQKLLAGFKETEPVKNKG